MRRIDGTIPVHLAQHAGQLRALEDALGDCLPAECCGHCRVAGIFGDTLVLLVDSPSWSARLRFYSARIISHFHHAGKPRVARVRTRVGRPPANGPGPPRRDPPLRMPQASARGFAELARATDDPQLRDALARLAAHAMAGSGEEG